MNNLLFKQKPQLFVRSARSPGFVQFCAVFGVLRSPTAGPIRAISCSFGSCTKRMLLWLLLAKTRFSAFLRNADCTLFPAAWDPYGSLRIRTRCGFPFANHTRKMPTSQKTHSRRACKCSKNAHRAVHLNLQNGHGSGKHCLRVS